MEKCPQCQSPTTQYPGGISKKSGKEYSSRTACENPNCSWVVWDNKKAPKTSQNATSGSTEALNKEVLDRLALRLENIDLHLKKLSENVEALSIFFRSQSDKQGSGVESVDKSIGEAGVSVSSRFKSQDVSPQENSATFGTGD